ncbi:iron-containing alcohol dehydrogenase [Thalassotalea ponticola]|uniref:iron-containing alcohol dehydrogenase n=1 Tax=Thalassotalea ponticola TaxID=1523392 RepID=UPI0025B544E9|nr:iron-containing alcohol dehydrogenase [Thalassotalea ponticola]MDN3653225.1 iron-containing alcohol dehydrogenase [Thalassotalea ponticola]
MTLSQYWFRTVTWSLKVASKFLNIPKPLLFCGLDSRYKLLNLIADQGSHRVLLVSDSGLLKLGLLEPLANHLEQQGVSVSLFTDIMADPSESVIVKGIHVLQQKQCDIVLAVGGGSAIDAAKMIAALARLPDVSEHSIRRCAGMLKIINKGLPLYVLPTTAGTGSEATMAAVVSHSSTGQKYAIISPAISADVAALDAQLMTKLPAHLTAATGMDALTHAIEAFCSKNASKETDLFALTATRLIFANLLTSVNQPDNLTARENMALASFYAGLAFNKAGVGYVHAFAHQLGAKYHISHGLANAMVLPTVMRFNQGACASRMAVLARHINLEGNEQDQLSERFIQAVEQLCHQLDIPQTVSPLSTNDYDDIIKHALDEAHYLYAVPRFLDAQLARSLLQSITA